MLRSQLALSKVRSSEHCIRERGTKCNALLFGRTYAKIIFMRAELLNWTRLVELNECWNSRNDEKCGVRKLEMMHNSER